MLLTKEARDCSVFVALAKAEDLADPPMDIINLTPLLFAAVRAFAIMSLFGRRSKAVKLPVGVGSTENSTMCVRCLAMASQSTVLYRQSGTYPIMLNDVLSFESENCRLQANARTKSPRHKAACI